MSNSKGYVAAKIAGITWADQATGRRKTFALWRRSWGVRRPDGAFLTFNGEYPSTWDTRRIAQFIADDIVDATDLVWIATINVGGDA